MNFEKLKEKYATKITAICLEDGNVLSMDQYKSFEFDLEVQALTLVKIERTHIEGQIIEEHEKKILYPFNRIAAVRI